MTAAPLLLAFDFDGTLSPICENPADAQLHRAASALLQEATELPGVVVAVVSGRDLDDLRGRLAIPGLYLVGSHGLEILAPGEQMIRETAPLTEELPASLDDAITRAGLRLERKKHAIALHWRGIDSRVTPTLVLRFRAWARGLGLDVIEGRLVVEARCSGGGKEAALRWVTAAIGASRVIYAGDDITDFGALRFAAERGRAVFVASDERNAPPGVTVVESFRSLFRLIRQEVMI